MTPAQLLLMCEIVGLLQVFDDSNGMTLLDALKKAVVEESNVHLYIDAFIHLGAGDDFKTFLEQPFMKFVDNSFFMMKNKLVCQSGSQSQLVIRNSGAMKTSSTEHPVVYFAKICKQAICDALIPAGARLIDGRRLTDPNLSSDSSFWADMCPRCGWYCGIFDHMDKSWGHFPSLGRGMWESIITEIAKEFFFMFCSEYAKFVCWVLENPFIFANRMIRRSNFPQTGREYEMGIPSLPGIFENEIFVLRTLLPCFVKIPTQDGGCRLVPSPFMMIIDPAEHKPIDDSANMSFIELCLAESSRKLEPKSKKMVHQTAMLTRVAQSLGRRCDGFADSILRRVLHAPNEGLLLGFKNENLILTIKLRRILYNFENKGLLEVFERLEELLE
jgi:hypothetical protein